MSLTVKAGSQEAVVGTVQECAAERNEALGPCAQLPRAPTPLQLPGDGTFSGSHQPEHPVP